MTTEHDLAHGRAAPRAPSPPDDDLLPGRGSRSSQLAAPSHPITGGLLLRKARDANGVADDAEQAVAAAASSSGHSLPEPVQRKFESSLGTDLSGVRVHTDADSARAADAVGAKAYAIGQDIHFSASQYAPSSHAGERLLAHEVAHTVQQRGGTPMRQNKLEVSSSGDAFELEADRAADAMIAGAPFSLARAPAVAARQEEDKKKPSGDPHPLTEDDKNRLANAKQLLDKAKANTSKATSALDGYAKAAPGLISQMKNGFDDTKNVYDRSLEIVNRVIGTANQTDQVKKEVLTFLLNQALGGITAKLSEKIAQTNDAYAALGHQDQQIVDSMRTASAIDALKNFQSDVSEGTRGGSDKATDAAIDTVKQDVGATPVNAPAAVGGANELEFVKTIEALHAKADKLLSLALAVAKLGEPLGAARAFVQTMIDGNRTIPNKSPGAVEKDAANVWNGSQGAANAAPQVSALTSELRSLAAQAQATKPKSDLEVEKELWVQWAGNLSGRDTSALNLSEVASHCKAIGIWDQLGIDPTNWWNGSDDEAMAVVSAYAQSLVIAHKGESVEVALIDGHAVDPVQLGELPELYAQVEGATNVHGVDSRTNRTKAVVIGARAIRQVEAGVLKKTTPTKKAVAEYLLKHGYIAVVVRPYDDPEAKKPDADPAD